MQIEVLKRFTNKRGIEKKHFMLNGQKEIAQWDHAFAVIHAYLNLQVQLKQNELNAKNGIEPEPIDYGATLYMGISTVPTVDAINKYPYMKEIINSMQKDQWRAIHRGKLFGEAFTFVTEDHFKPIPGKKQLCDEEYIKEYSKMYFEICYSSFAGPDGRVMFTDNIRVAVSAMVRSELANYGWEFDYKEVIDVQINEDLIQALIQLFPDAAELAGDIAQFHWFSKGEKDPYQNSKAQHIANSNTVRVFEEAIDFHYSDAFREIDTSNAFDNTIPTDKEVEQAIRQYILERTIQYVISSEALRGNILSADDEDVIECANLIVDWYYQIKKHC
jgi:hypothetical protein